MTDSVSAVFHGVPMPIILLVALSLFGCSPHALISSEAPTAEAIPPSTAPTAEQATASSDAHAASLHWRCGENDGAYRELIVHLKNGPMDPTLADTIRVRGFDLTANTSIELAGANGPALADLGVTTLGAPVDVTVGSLTTDTMSGPLLQGRLEVQLSNGTAFDLRFESTLADERALCG
jgi:hypothetical protein